MPLLICVFTLLKKASEKLERQRSAMVKKCPASRSIRDAEQKQKLAKEEREKNQFKCNSLFASSILAFDTQHRLTYITFFRSIINRPRMHTRARRCQDNSFQDSHEATESGPLETKRSRACSSHCNECKKILQQNTFMTILCVYLNNTRTIPPKHMKKS